MTLKKSLGFIKGHGRDGQVVGEHLSPFLGSQSEIVGCAHEQYRCRAILGFSTPSAKLWGFSFPLSRGLHSDSPSPAEKWKGFPFPSSFSGLPWSFPASTLSCPIRGPSTPSVIPFSTQICSFCQFKLDPSRWKCWRSYSIWMALGLALLSLGPCLVLGSHRDVCMCAQEWKEWSFSEADKGSLLLSKHCFSKLQPKLELVLSSGFHNFQGT